MNSAVAAIVQQKPKSHHKGSSPNNERNVVENREIMSTKTAATIISGTAATGTGATGGAIVAPSSTDSSSSTVYGPHHATLEQHCRLLEEENQQLKEAESRLQQQHADSQRRERLLMRRLANKEQELQDYVAQIAEYKNAQAPGPAALRSAMLDPAVNILFDKLKCELQSTRAKLEETQNELSAWKFTPDSNTGKRLMAKCRLLYQENEELGKMTSNGRLAKLEGELAMQKSFNEEVKKSQSELDDFIQELDEDVEGMQSTILYLQQELKAAKDRIQLLEKENCQSKIGSTIECDEDEVDDKPLVNGSSSPKRIIGRDISDCFASDERTTKFNKNSTYHIVHNSNNSIILRTTNISSTDESRNNSLYNGKHNSDIATNVNGGCSGGSGSSDIDTKPQDESATITNSTKSFLESSSGSNNSGTVNSKGNRVAGSQRKRNYDSDSSENSSTNGCTLRNSKKLKKKARRSSVLSIDLNEEDTQIADESEEDESTIGATAGTALAATPVVAATNPRIMTRRKSARTQQNGSGVGSSAVGGGGGGGDHN